MSHPAQVLVVRLSASVPGRISLNASFTTPMPNSSTAIDGNTLFLRAGSTAGPPPVPAGLIYENRLRAVTSGGSLTAVPSDTESHLAISKADSVTLFVAIASSYVNYDDISGNPSAKNVATLAALDRNTQYNRLKSAHVSEYQNYFARVEFDFGQNATAAALPTDVRASLFQRNADPGFVALNLNFARYLLISSSWGGAHPPNLQARVPLIQSLRNNVE